MNHSKAAGFPAALSVKAGCGRFAGGFLRPSAKRASILDEVPESVIPARFAQGRWQGLRRSRYPSDGLIARAPAHRPGREREPSRRGRRGRPRTFRPPAAKPGGGPEQRESARGGFAGGALSSIQKRGTPAFPRGSREETLQPSAFAAQM